MPSSTLRLRRRLLPGCRRMIWIRRASAAASRGLDANGRSRAYLNGSPVTVQQLREVAESLVDIHGQHAHQSLLRSEAQRALLDSHARLEPLLAEVATAWRNWRAPRRCSIPPAAARGPGRRARATGLAGSRTADTRLLDRRMAGAERGAQASGACRQPRRRRPVLLAGIGRGRRRV
jgi:hypothetical protein